VKASNPIARRGWRTTWQSTTNYFELPADRNSGPSLTEADGALVYDVKGLVAPVLAGPFTIALRSLRGVIRELRRATWA
jgi:hypothetical protein